MKTRKSLTAICLSLALLASLHVDAEAQRRGGGGGGNRNRTGTVNRTGPKGSSTGTFRTQVQPDRANKTRTVKRNGEVSTPKGDRTVQGQSTTERTGENTYDRDWSRTTTDSQGQSRTRTGEGSGTVEKTDSGFTRTYQGTTTTPNGQQYNVSKTAETVKTDSGLERDTTRTVTDSAGNVVGTGQSHTDGVKGQGTTTTGSWTGSAGQTSTYEGQTQRGEDGLDRTWMTTGPEGQTRSGESHWTVEVQPTPEAEPED